MRMLMTVANEMIHKVTGSNCLNEDLSCLVGFSFEFGTVAVGCDVTDAFSMKDGIFVTVAVRSFWLLLCDSCFSNEDFVIKMPGVRPNFLNIRDVLCVGSDGSGSHGHDFISQTVGFIFFFDKDVTFFM